MMEKKLVNDLSLHGNGNHLVVVVSALFRPKELHERLIASPDAECY